jgi:hypothetical protein
MIFFLGNIAYSSQAMQTKARQVCKYILNKLQYSPVEWEGVWEGEGGGGGCANVLQNRGKSLTVLSPIFGFMFLVCVCLCVHGNKGRLSLHPLTLKPKLIKIKKQSEN